MKAIILLSVVQIIQVYLLYGPTATYEVGEDALRLEGYGPALVSAMNKWGDWNDYPRCPVTGLSFYWTGLESIEAETTSEDAQWFKVSDFAARKLKQLSASGEAGYACAVAEHALAAEMIARRENSGRRIACPLKFFGDK